MKKLLFLVPLLVLNAVVFAWGKKKEAPVSQQIPVIDLRKEFFKCNGEACIYQPNYPITICTPMCGQVFAIVVSTGAVFRK